MVYVDYTVFGTSDLFDTFDGATDLEGKRLLNPKDTIANDLKLRSEVL